MDIEDILWSALQSRLANAELDVYYAANSRPELGEKGENWDYCESLEWAIECRDHFQKRLASGHWSYVPVAIPQPRAWHKASEDAIPF